MSWVVSCALIGSGVKRVGEGMQCERERADWRGERGEGVTTERIVRVTGAKMYSGMSEDKNRGRLKDWRRMVARTGTKVQQGQGLERG